MREAAKEKQKLAMAKLRQEQTPEVRDAANEMNSICTFYCTQNDRLGPTVSMQKSD